jgi:hypothetical protein
MTALPEPSQEAQDALADARDARANTEAILPLAEQVSRRVREEVEANHFLDLIQDIMRELAGVR